MADLGRRRWLGHAAVGCLLALDLRIAHSAAILAVRVWPARDYTRVTLELDRPLRFTHLMIEAPYRLVIDLENLVLDGALRELVAKVQPNDPYISQVRVGQFSAKVVRLVFDLKEPVDPQVFALTPIANYRHRLVIDLHPQRPIDPLESLVEPPAAAPAPADPLASLIRDRAAASQPAPAPAARSGHSTTQTAPLRR